jgi:hypothetical protein
MKLFFDRLNNLDDAMIVRPATDKDIIWVNNELKNSELPELPLDYVAFLKRCNGFAYNGVEILGTDIVTDLHSNFQLIDIVSFSENQKDYYDNNLLYFGRVDDDLFTYNPETTKYEIRDITSFDIMEEYVSLNDFLEKEIMGNYF